MNPQTIAIIDAVCCENLSDTEASMAFECSVEHIHAAIHNAMEETAYKRSELWQLLGKPDLKIFNYRRSTENIGARETILMSKCEARNEYFRRGRL